MRLTEEKDEASRVLTIFIDGSLDTSTALDLEEYMEPYYNQFQRIILDFANVTYLSSAGMRVLLRADTAMGGEGGFALRNVNSDVKEVLFLTGFCKILTILE